jgi:hypothetical protein
LRPSAMHRGEVTPASHRPQSPHASSPRRVFAPQLLSLPVQQTPFPAVGAVAPLEPEHVEISVLSDLSQPPPGTIRTSLDLSLSTQHIVERSHFVVALDAAGRPTRRLVRPHVIQLSDILISIPVSHAEHLLFGSALLKPDELDFIGVWLADNYTLAALQRASVHIVTALDRAQMDDLRSVEPLEQRAGVVAEATGRRANMDAARDHVRRDAVDVGVSMNSAAGGRNVSTNCSGSAARLGTGVGRLGVGEGGTALRRTTRAMGVRDGKVGGPRKRPRKPELLQERQSIQDTLVHFNSKIAMFTAEDPAMAEMLMPARDDLEAKLRYVNAQLASCGGDSVYNLASPIRVHEMADIGGNDASGDANNASGRRIFGAFGNGNQTSVSSSPDIGDIAAVPEPFVPPAQIGDDAIRDDSSSEDADDFRMALPIDGSEYDLPLQYQSGRKRADGYVSTSDDEDAASGPGIYSTIDLASGGAYIASRGNHGDSFLRDGHSKVDDAFKAMIKSNGMDLTPRDEPSAESMSIKSVLNYSSDLERSTAARGPRRPRQFNLEKY